MNLDDYCRKYNETKISEKQIELITNIMKTFINFETINKIIDRKIKNINELTNKECQRILNYYNYNKPMTEKQIEKIKELIPNEEKVIQLVGKGYNDLINGNWKKLIKQNLDLNFKITLNRFCIYPEDYVINANTEIEYGYQYSEKCEDNKLYYLKFYKFCMIDYDNISLIELKRKLYKILKISPTLLFYIYKTFNGYHVFIMSSPLDHFDYGTMEFLKNLDCDNYYIFFSFKNGFKIRLNKKKGRDEVFVHKYIEKIGFGDPDKYCIDSLNMLDDYINKHN